MSVIIVLLRIAIALLSLYLLVGAVIVLCGQDTLSMAIVPGGNLIELRNMPIWPRLKYSCFIVLVWPGLVLTGGML